MSRMGFSYKKVEELGVISPVVEISVAYRKQVFFDDEIESALALSSIMEFLWNLIMNFLMRAEMKSAQPLIPDIVF